jgi:superfamily II DNA or RNA helicase
MNYEELFEKYRLLLIENKRLTEENDRLKATGGITEPEPAINNILNKTAPKSPQSQYRSTTIAISFNINNASDTKSKIKLFMSLFKGRDDVYATRWENKKKGTFGYSPVCLNQWKTGLCGKPKISCIKCGNRLYSTLDEHVIEDHLRGNIVAGIYPMLPDETCYFLAIDFDGAEWQSDVSVLREVCVEFGIPVAVERSRSGKGGHAWFFFEGRMAAALARKFGAVLLTFSMDRRHEIRFKSYDRLFPNQDTMPKGGLGNLIALPFQKSARNNNNSEFVDERFEPYADQWAFLFSIRKTSQDRIEDLVSKLSRGHELGELKKDEEELQKPWEKHKVISLQESDFPRQIEIVKANMLFIPKAGSSQKGLNHLKRLATFKNPEFFKNQAMRLNTYKHPMIISCADEIGEYLCLPRGCEDELVTELEQVGIDIRLVDKTNHGKKIDVEFKGALRDEQTPALEELLHHDIGILSGTTAFGKTIVAIKLIAERKVNTLILVDKISLLSQWRERLSQFLKINESPVEMLDTEGKKNRKKNRDITGQVGAGKNNLSGIVDIAVMQSLSRLGEVKECVKNYGMIIADECHHAPAFRYENILKTTDAKYVYGLTATPARKDGHHPILLMQCGPIRFRDNPKAQAEKRPFDHYVIPRFTSLRVGLDREEKDFSIQDLYSDIVDNELRNQQIVEDVLNNYRLGRNCIVLSLWKSHVEVLVKKIREEAPDVLTLTGGMGAKTTRETLKHIADVSEDRNLIIVATGSFIGEGFDEPRLDTLFLAMPISWKGTLLQYAGRLHRLFENKKEVRIYDYADIHIKMLEGMYQKRLTGYASMGYKAKGEDINSASPDIIFDNENFLPVFSNDIVCAKKEIVIVSPFVRKRRAMQMMEHLKIALDKKVQVVVVTRPTEDFMQKDQVALKNVLDQLKDSGISVVLKTNIHQKFAVIDQKVVWYGSINLLSYGNAQESIMRIESPNIANELIKSIENR